MEQEEREEREERRDRDSRRQRRRERKQNPLDNVEREMCAASIKCVSFCSKYPDRETCPAYFRQIGKKVTFEGSPMEEKKVKK